MCLKRNQFIIHVIFTYSLVSIVGAANATFKRNPIIPGNSSCGFQDVDQECKACTTVSPTKIHNVRRVFGGREAYINEFPWMALLGYTNIKGKQKWGCGGTIISSRYILTAAHCIARIPKAYGNLTSVVLGEHDTKNDVDCNKSKYGGQICNVKPTSAEIEELIVHPSYNKEEDNTPYDIALIRLKRELEFSTFIQPICLPEPEHELWDGIGPLTTAGWGLIDNYKETSEKRTVDLDFKFNEQCEDAFSSVGLKLLNSQVCAGADDGRDTCAGDSGGPLMLKVEKGLQWFQIGIVSFGGRECGRYPAIYTKVANFVTWLHDNVKP